MQHLPCSATPPPFTTAPPDGRCDAAGELRWHVQLQDTVLFPGGGGQPCDLGYILPLTQTSFATTATTATTTTTSGTDSTLSANDSCTVVGDSYPGNSGSTHVLFEDATTLDPQQVGSTGAGGRVRVLSLHTAPDGTAVHEVDAHLPPGSLVRVELNWARRLDHMQQHTGQHLLSAVLEQLFTAPTTSWAMSALDGPNGKGGGEGQGAAAVNVTVRPPPGVDVTGREALGALEAEANRVVAQGRAVGVRVVQDIAQLPRLRGDLPDDSKLQVGGWRRGRGAGGGGRGRGRGRGGTLGWSVPVARRHSHDALRIVRGW